MFASGKDKDVNKILKHVGDLEEKGNISEAINELHKAIEIDPQDGNLFNRLGDLCVKNKDIKEATEAYKKGISAYKKEGYLRNAITLCKKIMRNDPDNLEVNLIIADLLVGLEEKRNALVYLFEYVEKQIAKNNNDAVITALAKIRNVGVLDKDIVTRVAETYKSIGKDNLAKEFTESVTWYRTAEDKEKTKEILITPTRVPPITQRRAEKSVAYDHEKEDLKDAMLSIDKSMTSVETAINKLSEAVRLDEVIKALDRSLITMSDDQKKTIALLQKTLTFNLDMLQKSVKDLQENAAQNVKEMKPLFGDLSRQLENLRNNQTTVTLKMNENIKAVADNFDTVSSKMNESLRRVSDSFNATAKDAFGEIKGVLSVYQKATDDMIAKLDETKNSSLSLLNVSEEIKTGIQRANNALTVFFTSQDVKDKRRDRYTLIMTIIIGIICGVLIFSLFR